VGYENPEDLEPSDWFVSLTRIEGVLLAVTGVVTLLVDAFVSGEEDEAAEAVTVEE
jgi:hypothetical protein